MKKKKEILSQIELRQSTIKDYLSCPLMFKMKHLEGIKPSYRHPAAIHGSTLHEAIHLFHSDDWYLDIELEYRAIFDYYSNESDVPIFWKKDQEKEFIAFVKNGVEILEGYRSNSDNTNANVLYSEVKFRVKVAGEEFTGTIDQVRKNRDSTLELIDFKSSKQRPNQAFLKNDWQLSLYAYALKHGELLVNDEWIKPRLLPDHTSWYFLRAHEIRKRTTINGEKGEQKGDPLLRSKRSIDDLKKFRVYTKNILNSMLKEWHYPNPNHCVMCSYKEPCMDGEYTISNEKIEQVKEHLAA